MKVTYVSWSRIRNFLKANLQFEERLVKVTINGFLLKMGQILFLKYWKTFMVMTQFDNGLYVYVLEGWNEIYANW